jgi:hypothetical protein
VPLEALLRDVLTDLYVRAALALASVGVLRYDIRAHNDDAPGLVQFVWPLTVAYSGPLGRAVYALAGRQQIARDSVWQRGARSVAHCYSGCGAGEATITEPLF